MNHLMKLGFPLTLAVTILGCAHPHRERFGAGFQPPTNEERVLAAAIDATHKIPGPLTLPTPFCVSFADTAHEGPVPGPELSRLRVSVHLIPASACPPTYTSMILQVDSLGRPLNPRPQGYIDPYYLRIWEPVRVTDRLLAVRIEATQGTRGWLLYCEVPIANALQASCQTLTTWISLEKAQPNQRLKLSARGGRLVGNRSVLPAAAAGRSLSAIR